MTKDSHEHRPHWVARGATTYGSLMPGSSRRNDASSVGGQSNSRAWRWPAYTAAAMVLGAKQSPIDVIETIPAASTAADSFKDCANSSFGRRDVTVTTDPVGTVVRRSVYVHSRTTSEPSNSTTLRVTYTSMPRSSTRF